MIGLLVVLVLYFTIACAFHRERIECGASDLARAIAAWVELAVAPQRCSTIPQLIMKRQHLESVP
jgi:hypothetical protein